MSASNEKRMAMFTEGLFADSSAPDFFDPARLPAGPAQDAYRDAMEQITGKPVQVPHTAPQPPEVNRSYVDQQIKNLASMSEIAAMALQAANRRQAADLAEQIQQSRPRADGSPQTWYTAA